MAVPWNVALNAPSVTRMIFTCTVGRLGADGEPLQLPHDTARNRSARAFAADFTTPAIIAHGADADDRRLALHDQRGPWMVSGLPGRGRLCWVLVARRPRGAVRL